MVAQSPGDEMTFKMVLKSLMNKLSFGIFSAVLIGYFVSGWEPFILFGFLAYAGSAGVLLLNPEFRYRCTVEDRIDKIRRLNLKSSSLYFHIKTKVAKKFTTKIVEKIFCILGKSSYVDLESRVDNIFKTKSEIANYFLSREYSPIKEKITLKSLELSVVYFRLMDIYISRLSDVSSKNLTSIEERISINRRKKIAALNPEYTSDLERAIEADEKLLQGLKEARKEVEKMSAKLNLIESTMALLKQQIYTEIHADDIFENIENTINEAQALENALTHHNKIKNKMA